MIPELPRSGGSDAGGLGGQKLEIGGQMLEVEYKVLDLN